MATALQQLERIAQRAGWRLRWKSERHPARPRFTWTELDIFAGRKLLTAASGPFWLMHAARGEADNGAAAARERIATKVLNLLPDQDAGASRPQKPRGV